MKDQLKSLTSKVDILATSFQKLVERETRRSKKSSRGASAPVEGDAKKHGKDGVADAGSSSTKSAQDEVVIEG